MREIPRRTKLDETAMASIAGLAKHKGFEPLKVALAEQQDLWFERFAHGLATMPKPVDQREVDEKRGFWRGVRWALVRFPELASSDFEKFLEEAAKEAEENSGS